MIPFKWCQPIAECGLRIGKIVPLRPIGWTFRIAQSVA
jgi:hypothetical protein